MMQTVWAIVHRGKIELLEQSQLPEGARVLVTVVPDDDQRFWLGASSISAATVCENDEDDVY